MLYKTRTKDNKADIGGTKDQKISIQKTPSFKGNVFICIPSPCGFYYP